jgi:hypothetical protein
VLVAVLAAARRSQRSRNAAVAAVHPPPIVRRAIEPVGLDLPFDVSLTPQDAVGGRSLTGQSGGEALASVHSGGGSCGDVAGGELSGERQPHALGVEQVHQQGGRDAGGEQQLRESRTGAGKSGHGFSLDSRSRVP